jgi:hypothetical protein
MDIARARLHGTTTRPAAGTATRAAKNAQSTGDQELLAHLAPLYAPGAGCARADE